MSGPGALSIRPRERPAARSGRSVVRAGRDSAGRAAAGGLGGLGLAELAEGLPDSDEHLPPRRRRAAQGHVPGAANDAVAGAVAGVCGHGPRGAPRGPPMAPNEGLLTQPADTGPRRQLKTGLTQGC